MNTGQKIQYFRKKKKLTQKKLAELSGIPLTTLQHYENSICYPSRKRLRALAQALELDPINLAESSDIYQTVNRQEKKLGFTDGYENGFEQLLFYDSLEKVRENIDNINNEAERIKLAGLFNDILLSLADYQENAENNHSLSAIEKWNFKQNKLSGVFKILNNYFDQVDSLSP